MTNDSTPKPTSALYTGRSNWETPQWFFNRVDQEFQFKLDLAASPQNTKCEEFHCDTEPAGSYHDGKFCCGDAFKAKFHPTTTQAAFINPPYSIMKPGAKRPTGVCGLWLQKVVLDRFVRNGWRVGALLPFKHSESWFRYVDRYATECRMITPRLNYEIDGKSVDGVNFGSCFVVFDPGHPRGVCNFYTWDISEKGETGFEEAFLISKDAS